MKKSFNFMICALLICTAVWSLWGCADNLSYEQEPATNNVREQLKAKLSHEVTQAEARENLEKLLLEMKIPSTRGGDAMQIPPITSVYTRGKAALATRAGEEVEPYFHIFNFGDNEGFAIMSGDDRVEPLLALTFEGELTPETEIDNPGFEIAYSRMEDYYVERIGVADTIPSIGFDDPILPGDSLSNPIIIDSTYFYDMPLGYCPVKWGQRWPYYKYCTLQPGNVNVPTGGARVAVAQLMSIYKYPNSYHSYLHNRTYYFDWNEMNLYTSIDEDTNPFVNDSTKYDQIAQLIYQLGTSGNLNVTYDEYNASQPGSCSPTRIPIALENFGYTSGGEHMYYDSDIIIDELMNGYPVLIGGSEEGMVNNVVHSHGWLGHGLMKLMTTHKIYQFPQGWITLGPLETYYIKCNWGWNGLHDGYYLSEVFDTNSGPSYPDAEPTRSGVVEGYYQYYIDAVVYIRK